MGALGGLLKFDGGPVDQSWLRALGFLLSRRGPDDEMVATAGSIGMVYRSYGSTPEDQGQSYLWKSPSGALLAFDGRLDNGPELADLLGLQGDDSIQDSSILLKAFAHFGAESVGKIVGDFALAYWDPIAHELILGRDALGARTLYYYHSAHCLAFSSDLGSLVGVTSAGRKLNEYYVAGYLSFGVDEQQTIYSDVAAVGPSQAVTISLQGKISKRTVWSLPLEPQEIAYRCDTEYEEHFLHLFRDAVRVRLRTSHPVVAQLSGGLDSSSVVCVADEAMRSGTAGAPSLSTVSILSKESTTFDERSFSAEVKRHCGIDAFHVINADERSLMPLGDAEKLHVPSFLLVFGDWDRATRAHMRRLGAHTLLTGHGGDEMFYATNAPVPGLGDLWSRGRWSELRRELSVWSHAIREPYLKLLWESFYVGIARRWYPPWKMRWSPPIWLHPRLVGHARANREARMRRLPDFRLPSRQCHAHGYYSSVGVISSGERQELDAAHSTHPCLHRPLVEFLHAVPFTQKLRCGESRSLQRRALRGILPPVIAARRGKTDGTEPVMRSLRDGPIDWNALLTNSIAEAHGYVDAAQIGMTLRRIRAGIGGSLPVSALALEMWLRIHHGALTARQASASIERPAIRVAS